MIKEYGFELRRQLFHMLLGVFVVVLLAAELITPFFIFVVLVVGLFLSFLSKRMNIPVISWFLRIFEREEERKQFPGKGAAFFTVGVLLTLQLFPRDIALASILILALGDAASHVVGRFYGSIKSPFNPEHNIEGTIAGVLIGFIGALFFIVPMEALLASAGAMVAESIAFDLNKNPVDDNIVVPLVAGTIVLLLRG